MWCSIAEKYLWCCRTAGHTSLCHSSGGTTTRRDSLRHVATPMRWLPALQGPFPENGGRDHLKISRPPSVPQLPSDWWGGRGRRTSGEGRHPSAGHWSCACISFHLFWYTHQYLSYWSLLHWCSWWTCCGIPSVRFCQRRSAAPAACTSTEWIPPLWYWRTDIPRQTLWKYSPCHILCPEIHVVTYQCIRYRYSCPYQA